MVDSRSKYHGKYSRQSPQSLSVCNFSGGLNAMALSMQASATYMYFACAVASLDFLPPIGYVEKPQKARFVYAFVMP